MFVKNIGVLTERVTALKDITSIFGFIPFSRTAKTVNWTILIPGPIISLK